jgi:hypothetical protein
MDLRQFRSNLKGSLHVAHMRHAPKHFQGFPSHDKPPLWGAQAIADYIGKSYRQSVYLLSTKRIPAQKIAASDLMPFGLPDLADPKSQPFYDDVIADADLIIVDNLSTICPGVKEN